MDPGPCTLEEMVTMLDQAFWRDKRVLVTGHTGFKGGWLCLWLARLGARVSGLALAPPTRPSLFEVARVGETMKSTLGDVRDLAVVRKAFRNSRPEIVFHMAAQPLVLYSYDQPVETYATNVMGTVNVLEACRQCDDVRAVVVVTSDKCYENREWVWGYRENEPMGGHDPYSSSKGCAELVAQAYRQSFFHRGGHPAHVASARAGNVIGGGDWAANRLIPDFMKSILKGEPVIIRSPRSIRPWQHVLEPLAGYMELAQRLYSDGEAFAEGWNFGPDAGDARSVQWIVERIARLWGEGARWQADDRVHRHEATYLKLDCAKAQSALGWRPRLNLSTALAWIVEWYQHYRDQADMREVTEREIMRYEQLSKEIS